MQRFKDFIYYNRKDIFIVTVMFILFFFYVFVSSNLFNDKKKNNEVDIVKENNEIETDNKSIEKIIVDIKGEVVNPNTYEVKEDDRVIDVINKAGGLTDKADVTVINLSEKIYDEMVIVIPSKEENIEKNYSNNINNQKSSDSKISINTASKEELMSLNGIGKSKAENIIEYRSKNGKFKSIDEIKNVSGIGDTIFEKIKDNIKI